MNNIQTPAEIELVLEKAVTKVAVHQTISDIMSARSVALHRATSDFEPAYKRHYRLMAMAYDTLLLKALALLPDNKPSYPAAIKHPTGERMLLQSVIGDRAIYVPIAEHDVDKFVYEPTDRLIALIKERAIALDTQQVIKDMEMMGVNPVVGDEEDAKVFGG